MDLSLILLIIAIILFGIAALNAVGERFNIVALGLAFFAASFLPI